MKNNYNKFIFQVKSFFQINLNARTMTLTYVNVKDE